VHIGKALPLAEILAEPQTSSFYRPRYSPSLTHLQDRQIPPSITPPLLFGVSSSLVAPLFFFFFRAQLPPRRCLGALPFVIVVLIACFVYGFSRTWRCAFSPGRRAQARSYGPVSVAAFFRFPRSPLAFIGANFRLPAPRSVACFLTETGYRLPS